MNNILEQLYNGEIYPSENIVPSDPQYRSLTLKISDEREALQTKLNVEDSERLEALGEMYVETSSMYGYENFLCGFKLGASLMLDKTVSRLSSCPLYGKTGSAGFFLSVGSCGGSAPTPPALSKEQNTILLFN